MDYCSVQASAVSDTEYSVAYCSLKSSTVAGTKYSGASDHKGAANKNSDAASAKGAATYVEYFSANNIADD